MGRFFIVVHIYKCKNKKFYHCLCVNIPFYLIIMELNQVVCVVCLVRSTELKVRMPEMEFNALINSYGIQVISLV